MPHESDVKKYYAGGSSPGYSYAGDKTTSLTGAYISTTEITSGKHDVLGPISSTDDANQTVQYFKFFYANQGADDCVSPAIFVEQIAGGADVDIGLDPSGISNITHSEPQSLVTTGIYDEPAGVSFSAPASYASGLSLTGDLGPSSCFAVWAKVAPKNNGPATGDGWIIKLGFESAT